MLNKTLGKEVGWWSVTEYNRLLISKEVMWHCKVHKCVRFLEAGSEGNKQWSKAKLHDTSSSSRGRDVVSEDILTSCCLWVLTCVLFIIEAIQPYSLCIQHNNQSNNQQNWSTIIFINSLEKTHTSFTGKMKTFEIKTSHKPTFVSWNKTVF